MSAEVAAAALRLVGARFRLHGRDPATGLDCVGVAARSLAAAGWEGEVPSGYAMRGGEAGTLAARLDALLVRSDGRVGEVALTRPGPVQLHLAVLVDGGLVHADAQLRRVVFRPGPIPWPVIGAWRLERTTAWRP